MPDWPADTIEESQDLELRLASALAQQEFLTESMADLQLALEDRGWLALSLEASREFTRDGRRRAAGLTRILSIQNPLIKRGLAIRTGYIWGQGVSIQAADETVNEVVQAFLDDNARSFASAQAQEELERSLGTDGNVFLGCFTAPMFGRVQVRSFDPDEIEEIICNPEDRDEPWFYLRAYTVNTAGTRYAGLTKSTQQTRRVLYPALGFQPTAKVQSIDGLEVMWDTPILHVSANRIDGWSFGIGDAYAAIPWARAYKEFLEDWAKLTKALSRFAWRASADKKGAAQKAVDKIRETQAAAASSVSGALESQAGATAGMANVHLEAISKSGATIDSDSGKPLAGMVAAALGVPLTMLLADPGSTGARAVAETLDPPTILEMTMRRSTWGDAIKRLVDYVIDQSVKAPKGKLKGTIGRDEFGREVITLVGADEMDRSVDIDWPSLEKTDPKTIVESIVAADGTDKVPPLTIARLLLMALGVDNIDDVLAEITDENGDWVDPAASAGNQAVKAFRDGQDPAEVV